MNIKIFKHTPFENDEMLYSVIKNVKSVEDKSDVFVVNLSGVERYFPTRFFRYEVETKDITEEEFTSLLNGELNFDRNQSKLGSVTNLVALINKKLEYYDRNDIKISVRYVSVVLKEALHELGYKD